MSKHQVLKNAIEAFRPRGADAPMLYATTELSDRSFKALIGRKIKFWTIHYVASVCIILGAIIFAAFIPTLIFGGPPVAGAWAGPFAVLFLILILRTTVIVVGDSGLDFYFVSSAFGSKYTVYDHFTLPYDRISNVGIKPGAILKNNRYLTFEFLHEGKKYKIKTSMAKRMRRLPEQEENLKYLLEVLEKKNSN